MVSLNDNFEILLEVVFCDEFLEPAARQNMAGARHIEAIKLVIGHDLTPIRIKSADYLPRFRNMMASPSPGCLGDCRWSNPFAGSWISNSFLLKISTDFPHAPSLSPDKIKASFLVNPGHSIGSGRHFYSPFYRLWYYYKHPKIISQYQAMG